MEINDIFAKIFEPFGPTGTFSDDLYQEGIYSELGFTNIIISFFIVILYYFILNRPKLNSFKYWTLFLLTNFIICFLIGILYPKGVFSRLELEYELLDYIFFGLKNAFIASAFFIIWTYIFKSKWFKSHCQGTPKLFFGK